MREYTSKHLHGGGCRFQRRARRDLLKLIDATIGHLPQKDVAERISRSPQYICDLMQGRRAWTPKLIRIVSAEFRLPRETLLALNTLGAKASGWMVTDPKNDTEEKQASSS